MILLLSGGQDSTSLLFYCLDKGHRNIHAITMDYGQTHQQEINAACCVVAVATKNWPAANISHEIVNIGRAALRPKQGTDITPARNLLFIAIAANRCGVLGETVIGVGACLADAAVFADCRPAFVHAATAAVSLSFTDSATDITIMAPMIGKSKKQIIEICGTIAGCNEAIGLSHTCYKATDRPCMNCAACRARAAGFKAANTADPLWIRISSTET